MAILTAEIFEPIHPGWTADSVGITADSVTYTADGGPLAPATDSNYAAVNANVLFAEIVEPVANVWTADATAVTADSTYWTADGGPLEGARDVLDAEVVSGVVEVPGGYFRPHKPHPVVGYGLGYLPPLEGEAFGVVLPPASADGDAEVDDELLVALMLLLDEAA